MKRTFVVALIIAVCCSSYCLAQQTEDQTAKGDTQKISLNLKNAPLNTVIYSLGKEAGMNIVTSGAIQGKVSVNLNNVSPYEALISVLNASGYGYKKEGEIIRIAVPPSQKLSGEQLFSEKGLTTRAFVSNNLLPVDMEELIKKLDYKDTKILSAKGSNVIVVEAPAQIIKKIDKILQKLDTPPNQVLVEARLMEITMGNGATPDVLGFKGKYTGTNYSAQTEGLANPATTGTPGFYAHVVKGNAEAYVEALQNKTGYNLLANPKVLAVSGKPANIISGSKLGYKTTLTTTTGTSQNVDFLEVGTKLSFTPYISSDGTIKMEIHPEVSEGSITTDGLPQKQTTEATTTVIVRDGDTVIIGGLIKNKSTETEKGVPVIMNIPIIGNFFKRKELTWEKTEIIAMLTPHIMTSQKAKEFAPQAEDMQKRQNESRTGEGPDLWWWVK